MRELRRCHYFVDQTIGESKMSSTIMYEAIWLVWRLVFGNYLVGYK